MKLALFDFDGTISTKDSFIEFLTFTFGHLRFFIGAVALSPYIVLYLLKRIKNKNLKEKFLIHFFKGTLIARFNELASTYGREGLPQIIRPGALEEIQRLRSENATLALVSASVEAWLADFASEQGFTLIASRLETDGDRITGRLLGDNCYGPEKVRRIKERFDLSQYDVIEAYGDSRGDAQMLEIATHPHFKPFRSS